MKTDPKFYDKESSVYSSKRYEGPLKSYTQYLFRKRFAIYSGFLKTVAEQSSPVSIFEIGCADGIILKQSAEVLGSKIGNMMGVDISPGMIEEATSRNTLPNVSFAMRGQEEAKKYDLVIELGVHVDNLKNELAFVKERLKNRGYFIYSVASRTSIHARLKLRGVNYLKDYLTYDEAEKILRSEFDIVKKVPYGFFVPKLWAIPFVGRALQGAVDAIMRVWPAPFHEQIYLLKDRRNP